MREDEVQEMCVSSPLLLRKGLQSPQLYRTLGKALGASRQRDGLELT